MANFLELPLELLPVIFDFVLKPQHISTLCLVNKAFNRFATPLLYRRVFIFAWYKEAKTKVVLLFQTLSGCPHLACHVEKLEIRDFPKSLSPASHSELLQMCDRGIRNCIKLRSYTWTRDGSLRSTMLESLTGCSQLQELEINGNDSGYNPVLLTRFSRLSKISLIMPSAPVLDVLPTWFPIAGETLRSLTIICKASPLVTDTFLVNLVPYLQSLEYLYIVGCPKVTEVGIEAIASTNRRGLIGISIEALSQTFDMTAFKAKCLRTGAFRRLRAVTLTIHVHMLLERWTRDVEELLSNAPLEALSIYSATAFIRTPIPDRFWTGMIEKHGQRLRKFSVHQMRISLTALKVVCSQCSQLERLFMVVDEHELDDAVHVFALAKKLRTLHINFPLASSKSSAPGLMERAISIVSACSPTLVRIGCNTRVWEVRTTCVGPDGFLMTQQVKRTVHEDENGEKYVMPTLAPQENPDIPEQFLVIRV